MSKRAQSDKKATPKAAAKKPATRGARTRKTAAKVSGESLTRDKQAAVYDRAMKAFNSGDFAKARDLLEEAAKGPSPEIAHAARMHRLACERRLSRETITLKTPEERYTYAVTLINQRRLAEAKEQLEMVLEAASAPDYVHYALAICHGLEGDIETAARHLEEAIRLDSRNRTIARNDPDFAPFASAPEIQRLLHPERADSEN